MSSPTGRREALKCLTSRGLSNRSACRHLGWSRRVATYELRQPGKDQALAGRLRPPHRSFRDLAIAVVLSGSTRASDGLNGCGGSWD